MKTNVTFQKGVRKSLKFFLLGFLLLAGGCYAIKYVIQPAIVRPMSSFNTRIVIKPANGENPSDFEAGKGILGVMLPSGWIVKDSIPFSIACTGISVQKGFFCYDYQVESFLNTRATQPPTGYHWWGASSIELINLYQLDTAYADITIITNEKIGEFATKYIVGDDHYWNKKASADPYGIVEESPFIPVKVDISAHTANPWINEEWDVYPNPSNGQLFIKQKGLADAVTLRIYDMNGRFQKSDILLESLNHIDLSDLPEGSYIVSMEKQGEIKSKKVIIQH